MFMHVESLDIGRIAIVEKDNKIVRLCLDGDPLPEAETKDTPLLREAAAQLKSYLKGELERFDLPLAPEGTEFMTAVWDVLLTIPFGETMTYKEVARRINAPNACRAVGMAANRNPVPIFIPCHRLVGSDGSLTGYRGGLALKERLLEMEREVTRRRRPSSR